MTDRGVTLESRYGKKFYADYPSDFGPDGSPRKFCPRCGEMKPWLKNRINFCEACVYEAVAEEIEKLMRKSALPADEPLTLPVTAAHQLAPPFDRPVQA